MNRAVLLMCLLVARPAFGGDYEELGKFEKEAVDATLAERRMTLDPSPDGKTIGRIHVASLDVFAQEDGFLQWFNHFHWVTRPSTIHREVLLKPGDAYDHALIDETLRNVRDPALHNVVVILPVKSAHEGKVDLLVVTRDVWSLRFNTNYQVSSKVLTLLSLSLAENNFLGLREQLAVSFTMDQSAIAIGPSFSDRNIAGTHLSLQSSFSTIFGRSSGEYEGTASSTTFGYPLWSLASKWGATMSFYHYDSIYRQFREADVKTLPIADSNGDVQDVPIEYRWRIIDLVTSVVRSFGTPRLKLNMSVGHELYLTRPSFEDDFPRDATIRSTFAERIFPRSELSSAVFARYHLYTPVYGEYRDFATYDLREDYALGPDADLIISTALRALGSDADFVGVSASGSWAVDPGRNSYLKLGMTWKGRIQDGALSDSRVGATMYVATPKLWSAFRVVAEAELDTRLRQSANGYTILGGETGLRGYEVGAFQGPVALVTHLELRTMPLRFLFFRLGGVAFWDMGHAAASLGDLDLHHDLGVGLRLLIPQINTYVFRFDWAFPTQGPNIPTAGRVSLGFLQVF